MKIDKGIPLPKKHDNSFHHEVIIGQMEIMDSVWFPMDDKGRHPLCHGFMNCAVAYGKANNRKFTKRKISGTDQKGIRVWRIK